MSGFARAAAPAAPWRTHSGSGSASPRFIGNSGASEKALNRMTSHIGGAFRWVLFRAANGVAGKCGDARNNFGLGEGRIHSRQQSQVPFLLVAEYTAGVQNAGYWHVVLTQIYDLTGRYREFRFRYTYSTHIVVGDPRSQIVFPRRKRDGMQKSMMVRKITLYRIPIDGK